MSDIFVSKTASPMLIGAEGEAFDSADYLHELKLDGVRCLGYFDSNGVEFRNKRNLKLTSLFPELENIHKQVKHRCILDGELIVIKESIPVFSAIQRRCLMSNPFKISLTAKKLPASFVPFDILYLKDKQTTDLPLQKRKELLSQTVTESQRIAISRFTMNKGIELHNMTRKYALEGIVSKRLDSRYYFGKRTKDWIKIKNYCDDDFIVCGYIFKSNSMVSLVLGLYDGEDIIYKGHVTLGVSGKSLEKIIAIPKIKHSLFRSLPANNEQAIWIKPLLVCTVKYMEKTASGSMRQPVFKGLREDKTPDECII